MQDPFETPEAFLAFLDANPDKAFNSGVPDTCAATMFVKHFTKNDNNIVIVGIWYDKSEHKLGRSVHIVPEWAKAAWRIESYITPELKEETYKGAASRIRYYIEHNNRNEYEVLKKNTSALLADC